MTLTMTMLIFQRIATTTMKRASKIAMRRTNPNPIIGRLRKEMASNIIL